MPTETDPDYLRELEVSIAQSKMKVLENGPILAPGKCCVCGSQNLERKYVDLGVEIQIAPKVFHVIYLCDLCVVELFNIARLTGILKEEEKEDPPVAAVAIINSVHKELDIVATSADNLLDLIGHLKDEINELVDSSVTDSDSDVSTSDEHVPNLPSHEGKSDSKITSRSSTKSTKSSSSRGSKDILSLADIRDAR
jgi:hypothetical protein